MAFSTNDLVALAYGNGFTLWHYTSADPIATVNTAGYFNDATGMLKIRDVIIVVDTTTPATQLVNVLANTGTSVDLSDGTAIVETNT